MINRYFLNSFIIFIIFLFISCGYRPMAYYTKKAFEGKVYVSVDINIKDSRNSILIKNILLDLIINKLKLPITYNKDEAKSFISGKILKIEHKVLSSDEKGFPNTYRENIQVEVKYNKLNETPKVFVFDNYLDYSVSDDPTLTEGRRKQKIQLTIKKSLSNLFSNIAVGKN